MVYMEDTVIFLVISEAHVKHLQHILNLQHEAGVNVKMKNYDLLSNTIN